MIVVPLINWQPIANIPDDRKDGRQMLLWATEEAHLARWTAQSCAGSNWGTGFGSNMYPLMVLDVTHWADINPPE